MDPNTDMPSTTRICCRKLSDGSGTSLSVSFSNGTASKALADCFKPSEQRTHRFSARATSHSPLILHYHNIALTFENACQAKTSAPTAKSDIPMAAFSVAASMKGLPL